MKTFGLRSIYVTAEEWRAFQAKAQAEGSTTNTWIRKRLKEEVEQCARST
jgi:hypothetical protein